MKAPDTREVGNNLLLLDINKDEPGRGITPRVSVYRCKKCYNSHNDKEKPRFLPWNLSSYVLNFHLRFI